MTVNKIVDLTGYGAVWFYEDGIANILSLNNVKKKHQVIYDSVNNDCFEVHNNDGTKCVFVPSKKEPFYSSVSDDVATALATIVEDKNIHFYWSTQVLKMQFTSKHHK